MSRGAVWRVTAHRQRMLIVVSQVAALTCWFSASAVSDSIRQSMNVSDQAVVLLASSVQLGFVIGALVSAIANLPDRLPPTVLYAASALVAAACTAALALWVRDFALAIMLRVATGVALAGVYPVGIKLMASWAPHASRAKALGLLVGGLTLGSAMPQLIRGFGDLPWQSVLLIAAAVTASGGLLVGLAVRPGPHLGAGGSHFDPRYALRMFRQAAPRLANIGYLGHMWELYALWTWLPVFVLHSQQQSGGGTGRAVNLLSFAAIGVAGLVGCLLGGWAADRFSRPLAAGVALIVSGGCCLLSPLVYGQRMPWLAVLVLVWGAAVIADSAVFSTALSETVDQRLVGTALTAQTAFGFLLTIVSIHLVPVIASVITWQFAFVVLAIGPVFGALAMRRFQAAVTGLPHPTATTLS
jgi:MFS family permease